MVRCIRFLLILAILVSCEATPEPTETPFVVQRIATTSEFETMVISWLSAYYSHSESRTLHLEILPTEQILHQIENGTIELILFAGEPQEGWFVTPLTREALAVIVNPDISVQSLSILELEELFSGKMGTWNDVGSAETMVQPVIPFKGSALRKRFDDLVMRGSNFDSISLLASTPKAMMEFVRAKPGALGFVPVSQLESGVRLVEVDGKDPVRANNSTDNYPLWVDLVAMSQQEPKGAVRDFLGWLQGIIETEH